MKKTRVLGIAGGGGALLHPFMNDKNYQILGNVEPRPVFYTKDLENWRLNFGDIPFQRELILGIKHPNIIVGSPSELFTMIVIPIYIFSIISLLF